MSRAVRTARGAFGALAATLFAAASHSFAGGTATPLAVLATALLALPLCVLLAGRAGSLWRLALAVGSAQFVYHWSFAGLGMASGLGADQLRGSAAAQTAFLAGPHAAHLEPSSFAPALAAAGSADATMWLSHAVAAVLTIALLHRGEVCVLRLLRVLRETVPVRLPSAARLPQRPAILVAACDSLPRTTRVCLSAISHRGPPVSPALTT